MRSDVSRNSTRFPNDFWLNSQLAYALSRIQSPRLEEAIGFCRAAVALHPQSPGSPSEAKNASSHFEHEATTSKISDDKLFYCKQRGLSEEEAVALIVNGFVRDVLQQLPMEFMAETQKLIGISLEGSVG